MMAPTPSATELRAAFDAVAPLTVGLEEELFLVDAQTLDVVPRGREIADGLDGRFKPELPAAQIEIVTAPAATVGDAAAELARARGDLAGACGPQVLPIATGLHPFTAPVGDLNRGERYDRIAAEYADVGRHQLVAALQIHVAVGGADRTLAVYNALRSELPLLAALGANAPFHGGRDTGLASWRPVISGMLPRQGIPPALPTWEAYASALRDVGDPALWWWELRPHPLHGTLELRVPDAQTTAADAAAVAAFAQCLVADLAQRADAGDAPGAEAEWVIAQERWDAARHGPDGAVGERLVQRLEALGPVADRLGCAPELRAARRLAERGGATRQREVAGREGLAGLVEYLAAAFTS